MRNGAVPRKTTESGIKAGVDLDGTGVANIATGIGVFDHMVDSSRAYFVKSARSIAAASALAIKASSGVGPSSAGARVSMSSVITNAFGLFRASQVKAVLRVIASSQARARRHSDRDLAVPANRLPRQYPPHRRYFR
jgi:hypothetical protein